MSKKLGKPYPNFGVVMLNLEMLRSSGITERIISELNTNYHPYPEQDAYTMFCGDRFVQLPPDYNDNTIGFHLTGTPEHSLITHFAGIRNWFSLDPVRHWINSAITAPRAVCYMGNRRYYKHMLTAARSLLCHSPVDRIYILTEDDTLPIDLPPCFHIINVKNQQIFPPDGPNINHFYTYITLMRAALTKVLPPDLDKVLLLDPDTIVCDDISPVWNYNLSGYCFAAVQETRNNDHEKKPYYNAGVMLMNLKELRDSGTDDRIIAEINTTPYKHMEQDVLNFLCDGKIYSLPSTYNASFVSDPCLFHKIRHYLSTAKRELPAAQQPYKDLPWNQIRYANFKET